MGTNIAQHHNKTIVLLITGSIAAIKAPSLVKLLRERDYKVIAVLTHSGQKFVTKETMEALTGERVYTELFSGCDGSMEHIELAKCADAVAIYPATAHFIANIAHGMAGDLAQTLVLTTTAPILLAPAMNPHMWENALTQKNVQILQNHGIKIVGPDYGKAACGDIGQGRVIEPQIMAQEIAACVAPNTHSDCLQNIRVLVTAGPTREFIDPVRFLSNASSGQQGYAIAGALRQQGANVTLISGPCNIAPPAGVHFLPCQTACEMQQRVQSNGPYDIAICTAAVSDFRPAHRSSQKIKKTDLSHDHHSLELLANPDILQELGSSTQNRPSLVVGFAAETNNVVANARKKLQRKQCDWIVANNVSSTHHPMGSADNQVTLITKNGDEAWPAMSKERVAQKLVQAICHLFSSKNKNQNA